VNRRKTGFSLSGVTLVEIAMGVLIGSMLILGLSRLFSSGLKTSQKGSSHLTLMQTAAVLLAQIEQDVSRASRLQPGGPGVFDSFQVDIPDTAAGFGKLATSTARYEPPPGRIGYKRVFSPCDGAGSPTQNHVFCSGLPVEAGFELITAVEGLPRTGLMVTLAVRSSGNTPEIYRIRRFIYGQNLPENRRRQTGDWRW
jgi:hypothetical protein